MHRTALLHIQRQALANALSQAWSAAPIGLPMLVLGAASLLIYQAASTYASLAACPGCAIFLRTHAIACGTIWVSCCILVGIGTGAAASRHFLAMGTSPWLAPLPWSDQARARAAWLASAAYGTALAITLAGLAWAATHALALPPFPAAVTLAVTGAAFCAASWRVIASPRQYGTPASGAPVTARENGLDWLDQPSPTHAGRWAMAGRTRFIGLIWLLSLLALIPALVAASLVQHQATIALVIAAAGANAIFILALRCHPLQSAALRATPLNYTRAAAAMCRAPLAFSLAWLALAALAPLAAGGPAWKTLPATIAGLLLLNALYAATALARPAAPFQAFLLYAAALYAVSYEAASSGLPYGALTLLAACAIAVLLVRRARLRYRALHG